MTDIDIEQPDKKISVKRFPKKKHKIFLYASKWFLLTAMSTGLVSFVMVMVALHAGLSPVNQTALLYAWRVVGFVSVFSWLAALAFYWACQDEIKIWNETHPNQQYPKITVRDLIQILCEKRTSQI